MTGSGGSALVALTFGTGMKKRQRRSFPLLVYVSDRGAASSLRRSGENPFLEPRCAKHIGA